jgi:hypothetical protein
MDRYAKAIIGALSTGLGAYAVAVADDIVTSGEWATIGVATLGALALVWGVPNSPEPKHAAPESGTYRAYSSDPKAAAVYHDGTE